MKMNNFKKPDTPNTPDSPNTPDTPETPNSMNYRIPLLLLCILLLLLYVGCKKTPARDSEHTGLPAAEDTMMHTARYRRPEIPQMMTDPQQRAAYYVKHYWDNYLVTDTAFVHSDDTEQLYVDFIDALQYVDTTDSRTALYTMMRHMEADSTVYAHFCLLSEKYLYYPNSPMRNESLYIPVLEQMIHSGRLTDVEKIRPADRLKQARKNRPGMKAADFTYVTPNGKTYRMSRLQTGYTLLFFYDPDCVNCRKHEQILSELPAFLDMQDKNELRVLAVYPGDNEEEWLSKSSRMPKRWITGWNKQGDIRSKMLYDIRATPSMYLLDKQKRVILKDASMQQLIDYLATHQQNP